MEQDQLVASGKLQELEQQLLKNYNANKIKQQLLEELEQQLLYVLRVLQKSFDSSERLWRGFGSAKSSSL